MASSPLVIWRLTDGKPGHMQQTLGLAQALSRLQPCQVVSLDVMASRPGLRDWLRRRFPPGEGQPRPDLIIGAGHATHLALLAARRAAGGRAIALMKPSLPLFLFDAVIAPEHDGLTAGGRVINTVGVLNPMQAGEKSSGSLLVLVGGPSKHVQWDDAAILEQVADVLSGVEAGGDWCLTDSRRTPDSLRTVLRERYGNRFQSFAECPPGWLATRLAVTDSVWVSEDSVSMVYEALTAGCRVGLLQLSQADRGGRVMRGVAGLIQGRHVTAFAEWKRCRRLGHPSRLDEAGRVARLLLAPR